MRSKFSSGVAIVAQVEHNFMRRISTYGKTDRDAVPVTPLFAPQNIAGRFSVAQRLSAVRDCRLFGEASVPQASKPAQRRVAVLLETKRKRPELIGALEENGARKKIWISRTNPSVC